MSENLLSTKRWKRNSIISTGYFIIQWNVSGSQGTPERKMTIFLIWQNVKKYLEEFWLLIIGGYVARNKSLKRTNVLKSTVFLILPSKNAVFRTLKNLKKSVSQAMLGRFESNLYQNICFGYAELISMVNIYIKMILKFLDFIVMQNVKFWVILASFGLNRSDLNYFCLVFLSSFP